MVRLYKKEHTLHGLILAGTTRARLLVFGETMNDTHGLKKELMTESNYACKVFQLIKMSIINKSGKKDFRKRDDLYN